MTRVLRLTLLAPEIAEAILNGRQLIELQLHDMLAGFPLAWDGQKKGCRRIAFDRGSDLLSQWLY